MSTGIQLSVLLRQDDKPSPGALPGALGDAFLCAKNPVFAAVRAATLRAGFSFDPGPSTLWHDYRTMALLCLPQILSTRAIPYIANKDFLTRLANQSGAVTLDLSFLIENLTPNYILHESCHAIARTWMEANPTALDPLFAHLPGSPTANRFVWQSVIEESFANALERIAWVHASSIAHKVFLSLHSYANDREEAVAPVAASVAAAGPRPAFRTLFLSFLAANLKMEKASGYFSLIPPWTDTADTPDLAHAGDRLSMGFRLSTAKVYYRLMGAEDAFYQLSAAPLFADPSQMHSLLAIARALEAEIYGVE